MENDVQTNLRIPAALKERLTDAARSSGRSLTAEVVKRLEESFEWEKIDPTTHPDYAERVARQEASMKALMAQLADITKMLQAGPPKGSRGRK